MTTRSLVSIPLPERQLDLHPHLRAPVLPEHDPIPGLERLAKNALSVDHRAISGLGVNDVVDPLLENDLGVMIRHPDVEPTVKLEITVARPPHLDQGCVLKGALARKRPAQVNQPDHFEGMEGETDVTVTSHK